MKKYFYSHLVNIESLIIELEELNLTKGQKTEIAYLIDSTLHNTILDTVLSELTPQEKYLLFKHLRDSNHSRIWELLNERIDNVENKIKDIVGELKKELSKDIKEAKNR